MKKNLLLTCLITLLFNYSFAQLTLKHSYTFHDGAATDEVAGANGNIVGGEIINGAYVTTADGQYIVLPAADIAINTYESITFEAYTLVSTVSPENSMLYFFGGSLNGYGSNGTFLAPQHWSGGSRAAISCGNITAPWDAESPVDGAGVNTLDEIYHLVVILTSNNISYYTNGTLVGTTELTGDNSIANLSNENAWIARGGYTGDKTWLGTLFEFNIYSGVMDDATIYSRSLDIPIETSIPTLASLSSSIGELSPEFNSESSDYEILVPYGTTSLKLTAIPTETGSTVEMFDDDGNEATNGIFQFGADGTSIEIIVTGLDGSQYSYYIEVYIDTPQLVATLSNIELSTGTLKTVFDPLVTEYIAYIPRGINTVDVTGIPSWEGETVTGGGTVDMSSGQASTTITVISEDGNTTMTYTIHLYWTDVIPGREYYIQHELSKCVLTGVSNSAPTITTAIKDDSTQLFTIVDGGVNGQYYLRNRKGQYLALAKTDNVWDMTMRGNLTADKDSSRFTFDEFQPGRFTIHSVKRSSFDNDLLGSNNITAGGGIFSDKWPDNILTTWSILPADEVFYPSDNTLSDLTIDVITLRPLFNPLRFNYDVTLPQGTTTATVSATASDATASVTGAGTIDVSSGKGVITITVTAADNSSKNYNIHYRVDPPATLVHSYTFADGTAQDQVGDADGIINGGTIVDGTYISEVDGDYITLPGEEIAINAFPSITIEAYVKTGVNPGWTMLSYFGNTTGGSNTFWLSIARNDDVSRIETNTYSSQNYTSALEPAADELHHVVGKLSNDTIYLYMDGVLITKAATDVNYQISQISNTTAWLGHGAYNDPNWKGSIYEFNIYEGLMDDATIAARSANFPAEDESSNATLSALLVDGDTITGFSPYILTYDIMLDAGSAVPTVTASTTNTSASAAVTAATGVPGTATVLVTAANGTTTNTYTVNFTVDVALSDDATLSDLKIDGTTVTDFDPATLTYNVTLAAGTTVVPTVTATTNHANATMVITNATSTQGSTIVVVTAEDGTELTYTINFSVGSGVTNANAQTFKVFPTLTSNYFVVQTPEGESKISMYDITGKMVERLITYSKETKIMAPRPGMYILVIETSETVQTFKVMKKRN